jgi:probable HAF family extracellular repeat protein
VSNNDGNGIVDNSWIWQNGTQIDSPSSDIGCAALCDTEVTGLNGSDQVAGFFDASGADQGFREDMTTQTFKVLPENSEAYGINASGQMVGGYRNASGQEGAFLWDGTTLHDLGTLGGQQAVATATSSTNQAVGCAQTSSGAWHPFLYQNGTMHDLGLPPGLTQACAYSANQHGWIVGGDDVGPWMLPANNNIFPWVGSKACHAWIRSSAGTYATISPPIGFDCITAYHIALNNQVVGGFTNSGWDAALFANPFTYENGTLTPLTLRNLPFDGSIDGAPVGQLGGPVWGNNLYGQLATGAVSQDGSEPWSVLLTPIHISDDTSPALAYRGSWSQATSAGAWGGTVHLAGAAGGSASFTFTGKTVSVIGPDGPALGSATIYIDGAKKGSVSETNSTPTDRNRIFQASFKSAGKHTLRVVAKSGFQLDAVTTSQR